ncbi:hypothetical protein DO233_07235 [Salmonella enterica]|nr:hypothetical protein [Salmonella enterica]EBJ1199216.1 hypothetical protein [Salmonella enterica]EBN9018018.1 hypothetical protein [Salmonella enterica]
MICLTIRAAGQVLSDLDFLKILAFYAGLSISGILCYCFYQRAFRRGKKRKVSEKIIADFMNEISFILLDYAINKSLPGRLIQVIARRG